MSDDRKALDIIGAGVAADMRAWSAFLDSAPGRYMLAWELSMFDAMVADVFGFNAVQLGSLKIDALRGNRMPCRVRVCSVDEDYAGCDLLVDQFETLPFDSQSLDLLVLPHVLEFAQDPHQVLRESERVLRPEGRLVLSGFNPVSLWGLRDWMGRSFERGFFPKPAHALTLLRLRDWCKLLELSVESTQHGCFRPPCRSDRWLARTAFLEGAGDRWWPICGAVYLLTAIKRQASIRLAGPAWKRRPVRRASVAVAAPQSSPRECMKDSLEQRH